ncbi:MAG: response regulator transcription factor [Muribaculaceae bacterium]|nr:response regulator transcription factor [Muribaculaceae bacterium]
MILLVMCCCMQAHPQSLQEQLRLLDSCLEQQTAIDEIKEAHIGRLRENFRSLRSPRERFQAARALYKEYEYYKYDSAAAYMNTMVDIAKSMGDADFIAESRSYKSVMLLISGRYKETFDELNAIDVKNLSTPTRVAYFHSRMTCDYLLASHSHNTPYRADYLLDGFKAADSICHLLPSSHPLHKMADFQRRQRLRDVTACYRMADRLLRDESLSSHDKAIITSGMATLKQFQGDSVGEKGMLARSAAYDIAASVKMSASLVELSVKLYQEGERNRANRYFKQVLKDHEFYKSRNQFLDLVEKGQYDYLQNERKALMYRLALLGALILLLLATLYGFYRSNKRLRDARKTIAKHEQELLVTNDKLNAANEQLQIANRHLNEANTSLQESNAIKEEYIGMTFYAASEYLGNMEHLSRTIYTKLVSKQYEALLEQMQEIAANDKERDAMYKKFDDTFLKLFPTFIDDYNALFAPSGVSQSTNGKTLTSEMRVFALIRLGVTDNERIAKFLNYSVHTVKAYKSRVKNRAIVDNNKFEELIKQIGRR